MNPSKTSERLPDEWDVRFARRMREVLEERDSLREFAEFAIARGVEKNDPFLVNKARRALGERL